MNHIFRKHLVCLIIGLLAIQLGVQAQSGRFAARQEQYLQKMQEELALSDNQVGQIKDIQSKYFEKIKDLRQDANLSQEERRSQFKELRKAQEQEMQGVLSTEQFEKFQSLQQERRGRMQEGRRPRMDKEDRKAMNQELKTYYKDQIMPVVLEQRAKFDQVLDNDSKAKIENARVELKSIRQEMKAAKKEMKDESPEVRKEKMMALKEQFKGDHQAQMQILQGIADQYQADINRLHEEIAGQEATWKSDLQAISEKYRPAEDNPNRPRRGPRSKKKFQPMRSPVRFLLLDPNKGKGEENIDDLYEELLTTVYPNPAVNNNTISFDMKKAGQVKIDLYNEQGELVKNIFNGYQSEGYHKINIDTQSLQNATYYYVIEKDGSKQTETLIIQK